MRLARLLLPLAALWLATACGQIGAEPDDDPGPSDTGMNGQVGEEPDGDTATDEVCDNEVDDDEDGLVDCDDPDCDGDAACP